MGQREELRLIDPFFVSNLNVSGLLHLRLAFGFHILLDFPSPGAL